MIKQQEKKGSLVSVVIPSYNRGHILSRAISSVLSQTYENIELIIVDDGSTDDTEKVVATFQDCRLRYLCHSENKGISAARNTGIKESKGDFIALLDSDDEFLPDKIRKSLEIFLNDRKDVGAVCSRYLRAEQGKKLTKSKRNSPFLYFGVFDKIIFQKIGFFDEDIEVYEDLEFYARFLSHFNFYCINHPLAIYHSTIGSMSSSFSDINRLIEIKQSILDKHSVPLLKSMRIVSRKLLARIHYFLGKDLLSLGLFRDARRCFFRAFLIYPLKIEYFFKFLKYFFKKRFRNI